MIYIPEGSYDFVSYGIEIEGDILPEAVDVQYPWE